MIHFNTIFHLLTPAIILMWSQTPQSPVYILKYTLDLELLST